MRNSRNASFFSILNSEVANSLREPIDLEKELASRGFPLASHGRVDWEKLSGRKLYEVTNDHEAAEAIIKIINDCKLAGQAMVVWTDSGINPLTMDVSTICQYADQICEEDWDCWIISESSNWIIEKYHEGEVCFTNTGPL
jgi:hypothetical protein